MPSPFPPSTSTPGTGIVHLTLQPPNHPVFPTFSYSYPLKLVVSAPHTCLPASSSLPTTFAASFSTSTVPTSIIVPLLFLLTYGGGLVSGDAIALKLTLAPHTRLVIASQGSTKIFKPSLSPAPSTTQSLVVSIAANSALWLAPDPCQPFAQSLYAQTQIFDLDIQGGASVGVVDWVSEGRGARGEKWACEGWRGRNEVWDTSSSSHTTTISDGGKEQDVLREEKKMKKKRILLRDALILSSPHLRTRTADLAIFGTVILVGPLLAPLADFFIQEFTLLPRIGGRNWDAHTVAEKNVDLPLRDKWRKERHEREKREGILWTAARVRGGAAVVVKFAAKEVEAARMWLGAMLKEEGTVGREFGPGGLICVK
ncbi:MAG: hypothetical protein Q9220_000701 [cf. Caloplaca sp. 1 TL-2023]